MCGTKGCIYEITTDHIIVPSLWNWNGVMESGVIWIGTCAVEWPECRRCVMWNEVECGPWQGVVWDVVCLWMWLITVRPTVVDWCKLWACEMRCNVLCEMWCDERCGAMHKCGQYIAWSEMWRRVHGRNVALCGTGMWKLWGAVPDDVVWCIMWPIGCDLRPIWYCKVE